MPPQCFTRLVDPFYNSPRCQRTVSLVSSSLGSQIPNHVTCSKMADSSSLFDNIPCFWLKPVCVLLPLKNFPSLWASCFCAHNCSSKVLGVKFDVSFYSSFFCGLQMSWKFQSYIWILTFFWFRIPSFFWIPLSTSLCHFRSTVATFSPLLGPSRNLSAPQGNFLLHNPLQLLK